VTCCHCANCWLSRICPGRMFPGRYEKELPHLHR
jgi:hypothetical protein